MLKKKEIFLEAKCQIFDSGDQEDDLPEKPMHKIVKKLSSKYRSILEEESLQLKMIKKSMEK